MNLPWEVQHQNSSKIDDFSEKSEDFKNHIEQTVKTEPDASWTFVVDQLNTHMSESLVLLVIMLCGLTDIDVGKKGKSGILKNMQTRKEFLSNHHLLNLQNKNA